MRKNVGETTRFSAYKIAASMGCVAGTVVVRGDKYAKWIMLIPARSAIRGLSAAHILVYSITADACSKR